MSVSISGKWSECDYSFHRQFAVDVRKILRSAFEVFFDNIRGNQVGLYLQKNQFVHVFIELIGDYNDLVFEGAMNEPISVEVRGRIQTRCLRSRPFMSGRDMVDEHVNLL